MDLVFYGGYYIYIYISVALISCTIFGLLYNMVVLALLNLLRSMLFSSMAIKKEFEKGYS